MTSVYCAHEYTLSNLRFARAVEPQNEQLLRRQQDAEALRERGEPTVPSTIALELATNPFLRCGQTTVRAVAAQRAGMELAGEPEVFGLVRSWKDDFR
jgi:hydroxyacylglutathione hydrolase